jgi:hypothetical protein
VLEDDDEAGAPEDWLATAAEMMMPGTWSAPPVRSAHAAELGLELSEASAFTPPPVAPDGAPAGSAARRPAEAQGCYERALVELRAGRVDGGAILLRRALALAPGDAEIAGALASVTGAPGPR